MTELRQEIWVSLGFGILLFLLLIAWRIAVTIGNEARTLGHVSPSHRSDEVKDLRVTGGQLVAEIPERKERWVLQFTSSRYDPHEQVATTQNGICQVTRKEKVVAVFQAPTIIVRFKEREMEMKGGVSVIAILPKLRANLMALKWNWETGQLVGMGQVKIEGERFSAVADSLEGDTTLMQVSLKGKAKLDWHSKSGDRE